MAATRSFITETLRPLSGSLDCRTSPDSMDAKSFRWLLNFGVDRDGRRQRRPGWGKLNFGSAASAFVNQDLHDQRDCWAATMLGPDFIREPITLLFQAESNQQERRLYAATRSRIYLQTGNEWRIIARDFGGTTAASRFQAAQLGNSIVFTNGIESPRIHTFGTAGDPCAGSTTLSEIPELKNASPAGIKLQRAKFVQSFNGSIFLLGTVENGVRYPSRIRFSGFNSPLRWLPGNDTIAGFQDLPYDENITGCVVAYNTLIIFTDKSIYKCVFAGASYTFERVYAEPRGATGLPAYPNSIVTDGETVWWMARDAVYKFNIYVPGPVRDDAVHRAAKEMYDRIDPTCCDQVVAGFNPQTREVWWSYPVRGDSCTNSRSLVYNVEATALDYVDAGFSAFTNFAPDERQTLGEWLDENCTTDLNQLCETLGAKIVDDFCGTCSIRYLFVGAAEIDLCLKDLSTSVFYRERCTNPTDDGTFNESGQYVPAIGTYAKDGYYSILRSLFPFGHMSAEKVIKNFLLDTKVTPAVDEDVSLRLRVGTAYSALDPNPQGNPDAFGYSTDANVPSAYRAEAAACEVIWRNAGLVELRCPETRSNVTSLQRNTRPNLSLEWPLFEEGRFLYYEVAAVGPEVSGLLTAPIGGESFYNRIEVRTRLKPVAE
jgi:hypothetical protein